MAVTGSSATCPPLVAQPDATATAPQPSAPPLELGGTSESGSVSVRCVPEYREMEVGACKLLSMVEVEAGAGDGVESERAPIEVCAVIDRSGSMRVQKLALVLQAMEFVVRELLPHDRLCIITYDHNVHTVLPMTRMTAANRKDALARLKTIQPGGSTFLSGGLLAGLQEMRQSAATSTALSRSVWLFTDGQATTGLTTTDSLLQAMHGTLGESTDMTVYTFGFGDTHNDEMLRSVAEAGAGMYYYLREPAEIPACFAECLGGLMSTAASDITVTFTPSEGVTVASLPDSTETTVQASGEVVVQYKDLYAEETRNVIIELALPEVAQPNTQVVGCVVVGWTVKGGVRHSVEAPLAVDRVESYSADREADEDVTVHRMRIDAAAAIQYSRSLAERGEFRQAAEAVECMQQESERVFSVLERKRVSQGGEGVKSKKKKRNTAILNGITDDMQQLNMHMNKTAWAKQGSKHAASMEMGHRKQRAAKGKSSAYSVAAQKCMIEKMNVQQ